MQSVGQNPSSDNPRAAEADALARAQRRRWALEALDFERSRESALEDQLEEVSAELEGSRIDAEIFARISPADVEVIRSALGEPGEPVPTAELEYGDEIGRAWQDDEVDPEAERRQLVGELTRLRGEIDDSRRRQQAFEHYLDALSAVAEGTEA
jgi:hypothetical protein